MALTRNGVAVDNVQRNGVDLAKVTVNDVEVWPEWVYKTGNLVKMTANSMNGYTASKAGWYYANQSDTTGSNASTWWAFDGDTSTYVATNNPNEGTSNQPAEPYIKLLFPNPIKIVEIQSWIGYGAEATDESNWFHIYGIKADGTEVKLATNYSGVFSGSDVEQTHTVSTANQEIEFVGIVAHRTASGAGWYRIYDIQITKWWQKD